MLFGNFAESQSKDFNEAIDEEEYTEDYGYLSDSDLEDDGDEKPPPLYPTSKSNSDLSGENKIVCGGHEECIEMGKVVKIPDIAFVTCVKVDNSFIISLMSLQVPGFSDVSLHGCGRVRAVWI